MMRQLSVEVNMEDVLEVIQWQEENKAEDIEPLLEDYKDTTSLLDAVEETLLHNMAQSKKTEPCKVSSHLTN